MTFTDAPPTSRILTYPPKAEAIAEAAQALAEGQLIALATETVFGIAADAANSEAVAALYEAKGRDMAVPLQILVPDLAIAEVIGHFSDAARRLAARFWPGPLTLVVPLRHDARALLAAEICGDQTGPEYTIGIRMPAHPVPQALLHAYGAPLAASSANRSGQPAALSARETDDVLGSALACILDGPCDPAGLASTVVDTTHSPVRILREGAITTARILAAA